MGYKTLDCPVSRACGGCEWLAVPYPIQLERKEELVRNIYTDLLDGVGLHPILGMDDPMHFRNKIIVAFRQGKGGSIRYGLYARGSHKLVEREDCIIEHEAAAPLLASIASLSRSFKLKPYDEGSGSGFLRYALIRIAQGTGQVLVCLVCTGSEFKGSRAFVRKLRELHPAVETIVLNVNRRDTNVVLGEKELVLYGPGWIEEELLDRRFRISAQSFFQVNPLQTEVLYSRAIEIAGLTGAETIIDAYCGTGTIGLLASEKASRLIGIEENKQAVRDARANAKRNSIANAEFVPADAGKYLRKLAAEGGRADVVFMDPPRSGSDEDFLDALAILKPKRIVYISCNPETQARDVRYLLAKGYALRELQPVDMFPHTKHVECIALMTRRGRCN